nr:eIF-2-alpha kinase activator GCN1 isoform X17 [Ipomoea batatas]
MLVATSSLQALSGVYAKYVHVRVACLNAVKCVPALAGHSIPEIIEVATSIWLAFHFLCGYWNHSAFCCSLHFVKFEIRMISECIKFLSSKKLQYPEYITTRKTQRRLLRIGADKQSNIAVGERVAKDVGGIRSLVING